MRLILRSILEPLGLQFDPRQLAWADAARHEVAGNHIRFDATSRLVLDEAWKQGLSRSQQLAIDMGTLLSRQRAARTGYVTRD
jgi:hypothetical protein